MAVDKNFLLVLKSAKLGDGEPEIGATLMKNFLAVLLESGRLPAKIICMNSAVLLTTEPSPILDLLKNLEAAGSLIFSCGTCLEYYQRKDKIMVGSPGNMRDTVAAMLSFEKVIHI